jgi:branched-chain amino acid transport system permease protein
MDFALVVAADGLASVSMLVLICLGLFIVFGLMRVINFAHAEFVMIGAVATVQSAQLGVPFWLAALIIAPLLTGIVAQIVEWLIIRHLYGRVMQTLLATWGVSLVLVGGMTALVGTTAGSIAPPLGFIPFGEFQLSTYRLAIIGIASLTVVATWYVIFRTRVGVILRAATQNPSMISAMGYSPALIFRSGFVVSGIFAGLAGGLMAPLTGVVPTMGTALIADSFITVMAAGSSGLIANLVATAAILSSSDYIVALIANPILGNAVMLMVAVAVIRWRPGGIFPSNFGVRRDSTSEMDVGAIASTFVAAPRQRAYASLFIGVLVAIFGTGASIFFDAFFLLQITAPLIMAIFALSLAFCWGFGGIASFGHSLFFGVGAYAFAITSMNYTAPSLGIIAAIVLAVLVSLFLAILLFIKELPQLHISVITLCSTLIAFGFISSTSDPSYTVLGVRLNGFNGISAFPTMTFDPVLMFHICLGFLTTSYLFFSLVLLSRFGRLVMMVRDNSFRAALLGVDPRVISASVFIISGAFAGLAGALYANWSNFVGPDLFSLAIAASVVIWVVVGGLGTLIGPALAAVALEYLPLILGRLSSIDAGLTTGLIMIFVVLFVPAGLVPSVLRWLSNRLNGQ